jgi:NADH-quinone oxidoreductase subunit E
MRPWTKAERVTELIAEYPDPRSAVMPLLYLVMGEDGYVTDEGMREVAELVGMSAAQVSAVASFYSMYKRENVGRYLLSVCTSISCMLLGGKDVLHAVESAIGVPHGETDAEGFFSVEHVECIGACGGAPALQVNYELVEGVGPEKGRELVDWLKTARPDIVLGDEMQALFGGHKSFEWGPHEPEGAVAPVPAIDTLGSSRGAR